MIDERAAKVKAFWESLTPESLARLSHVYADDVYFRDPFNETRGIPALRDILDDMFRKLHEPRFEILEIVQDGASAILVWNFHFRMRTLHPRRPRCIHGTSHVRFGPDGRVAYHRDYWDAAGELFTQLPVLGRLMRWLGIRPRA